MTRRRNGGYPPGDHELSKRMAKTAGADLSRAWTEGRVSADTIARAMGHCAAYGERETCRIRPDAHRRGAEEPPRCCVNAKLLTFLATQSDGTEEG